MRSNKLLKILWGVVFAIFVICVVFVVVGYFGGGNNNSSSNRSSNNSSQTTGKDKSTDEEKYRSGQENQSSTTNKEDANDVIIGNDNGVIDGSANNSNNNNSNNNQSEYNGKKLSHNEGVGTSGKVFSTQKEALEYGNSEIERLVKEDRIPRQFSISKVSDEDGNIVGWTVDIFENGDSKAQ